MNKKLVTLPFIAFYAIGFIASDESNNSDISSEKYEAKAESPKSIYEMQDVSELRKAINNTVWTHTATGDQWLRYEFVGNTVKQYSAFPKYGKWRYDGESQYILSEYHTQYDGRKFFTATFQPKTESLAMFELDVNFNFDNYHLYLNGQDIGGFVKADYEFP